MSKFYHKLLLLLLIIIIIIIIIITIIFAVIVWPTATNLSIKPTRESDFRYTIIIIFIIFIYRSLG